MARRRRRRAQVDYGYFRVQVTASSVYINHRTPDPKYDLGWDAASTSITIEGMLDTPVIRREAALVYVHGREKGEPGGAIGVNASHWQVLVYLPRPQFADLMTLVAARRLARIDLLTDTLKETCAPRTSTQPKNQAKLRMVTCSSRSGRWPLM